MLAPKIRLKLQQAGCSYQQISPAHNCVQVEITPAETTAMLVVLAYKESTVDVHKQYPYILVDATFYALGRLYVGAVLRHAFKGRVMSTRVTRYVAQ